MRGIHCTAPIMGSEHKDRDKVFSRSHPQTRVPLPPAVFRGVSPASGIHQKGQPLLLQNYQLPLKTENFSLSFFNSDRLGIQLSRIWERTIE